MKPKPTLRTIIILITAAASIFFLENTRRANKMNSKSIITVCCQADTFKASNNDFIFFESISKYLLIPLVK